MNSKQLGILIGAVVLVVLGILGYRSWKSNSQEQTLTQQNATPSSNQTTNNTNTQQPVTNNTPPQQTPTTKVYTNTTYGYQFSYPSSFVSISPANREVVKPLTNREVTTTNNLIVAMGKSESVADGEDVMQVDIIRNQDEAGALFSNQKLNDTSVWSRGSNVTIGGVQFSKYIAKNPSDIGYVEAYYGTDDKNYFFIGVFNKAEASKILSTFKFVK